MSSVGPANNSNQGVENSTWVEDWTANLDTDQYIDSLPQGVNTINIFVGQLDIVNGQPTIDGFTASDTPGVPGTGAFPDEASLTDFISKCQAKGIAVKLSIGGASNTTFGQSWNNLTDNNINDFAQALVNFCKTTGANGIDFDDELEDTTVAARAGKLAAAFKTLDPDLQASFCVYGGIDDSGPMHDVDTIFLQNALLGNGDSAIDRVYVMTYYDGSSLQENEQYMLQWAQWLKDNYSFSSSQISCGVDPNDPNTSPNDGSLAEWIKFAKDNGFSTAIWDQQGVDDYVNNDWGDVIRNLYNSSS